jgi:hypothetical protein
MSNLTYTTVEDERAAIFCDLAAARLRNDHTAMQRLIVALHDHGYLRPLTAAERIARLAIDVERQARAEVLSE